MFVLNVRNLCRVRQNALALPWQQFFLWVNVISFFVSFFPRQPACVAATLFKLCSCFPSQYIASFLQHFKFKVQFAKSLTFIMYKAFWMYAVNVYKQNFLFAFKYSLTEVYGVSGANAIDSLVLRFSPSIYTLGTRFCRMQNLWF